MQHRTPDEVSKARQKLSQEIEKWEAGIAQAQGSLQLDAASRERVTKAVEFGKAQIERCRQKLKALRNKGIKPFWH